MKKIISILILAAVLIAIYLLRPQPEKTFERAEEYTGPNTNSEFNLSRNER